MFRFLSSYLLLGSMIATPIAISQQSANAQQPQQQSNQRTATIEGLVRDIACPIQNLEAKATDFSLKCAVECARKGSPLIILTKAGEIYIPISGVMPDTDQREKLMPFVGKYVRASGTVYERKGTQAIVIAEIKELKDVPLKIE
jgi:hypothetical protein